MIELEWLPAVDDWSARLTQARSSDSPDWPALRSLAASSIDFLQTDRLDRVLGKTFAGAPPEGLAAPVVRIAVTGSATLSHLAPALRIAAARRNMWAEVHVGEYGQYHQELEDPDSALWQFNPTALLIALDARHLFARQLNSAEEAAGHVAQLLDRCEALWAKARARGLHVIHQTAMPVLPQLAGNNEHRVGWSAAGTLAVYNEALRARADAAGVDLLDLSPAIAADGLKLWHDPALWHRAKQEVTIRAAPAYGDLVMRLIAARAGRSAKCLVLDLDNTLWGGVIGDDGLAGIVLGQGNAAGEAHLALQAYARDLTRRGVILAVCSKNDEANALEPFDQHPDMLLRRSDIACFVANW